MKKWAVGFAISMGCQTAGPNTVPGESPANTDPETETIEQALEDCYGVANFCGAGMPQISPWQGGALPPSTPSTVILVMRAPGKDWVAVGADPDAAKVRWGLSVPTGKFGTFMSIVNSGVQPYGGVRPPPPDDCPPLCGGEAVRLLETALRIRDIASQVDAAVKACPK